MYDLNGQTVVFVSESWGDTTLSMPEERGVGINERTSPVASLADALDPQHLTPEPLVRGPGNVNVARCEDYP